MKMRSEFFNWQYFFLSVEIGVVMKKRIRKMIRLAAAAAERISPSHPLSRKK